MYRKSIFTLRKNPWSYLNWLNILNCCIIGDISVQSTEKKENLVCLPRSRATWTWTGSSLCPVLSRKCTLQPSVSTSMHLWSSGEGGTVANTPAWPTRVRFRCPHLISHSFGFRLSEKALHKTHSLWRGTISQNWNSLVSFFVIKYPANTTNFTLHSTLNLVFRN